MMFTCFNAPNSWRLGWSLPTASVNGNSLPVGVPYHSNIYYQLSTDSSFLRVQVDWNSNYDSVTGINTQYFISYRKQDGLSDQMQPMVYIHYMQVRKEHTRENLASTACRASHCTASAGAQTLTVPSPTCLPGRSAWTQPASRTTTSA